MVHVMRKTMTENLYREVKAKRVIAKEAFCLEPHIQVYKLKLYANKCFIFIFLVICVLGLK